MAEAPPHLPNTEHVVSSFVEAVQVPPPPLEAASKSNSPSQIETKTDGRGGICAVLAHPLSEKSATQVAGGRAIAHSQRADACGASSHSQRERARAHAWRLITLTAESTKRGRRDRGRFS